MAASSSKSIILMIALLCAFGITAAYFVNKKPAGDGSQPGEVITDRGDSNAATSDVPRVEPPAAWKSEEFAESAGEQLKLLGKALQSPAEISASKIEKLIAPSISTTALKPAEFETGYESDSMIVRQGKLIAGKSQTGVDAVVSALKQMTEPLESASHIHSKFKIISVDIADDGAASTDMIVQYAGELTDGAYQLDAIWNCEWDASNSEKPPLLTAIALKQFEDSTHTAAVPVVFSDCTQSVFRNEPSFDSQLMKGIDYWRSATQKQYAVYPFGHHGIAIGDVNGDGLDDLYSGQPVGLPNRLYLQQANGTVVDIAHDSGVDFLDRTRGVLLVDIDNDSDQDLVAVLNEVIIFMANDGQANFTEMAVVPTSDPGALSAADYDQDGDLDVFVVNYGDRLRSSPEIYHDSNNGGANVLLRNDGDWQFVDVTEDVGLNQNNQRWSLASSWEDFDNDGDLDLYVANDFGRNNLYENKDGQFFDIAAKAGVEDIAAGMSASWADANHDGQMDLYVGNMFSSAGLRVTGQNRFQKRATDQIRDEFRRHARGNSLFQNLGNGKFSDVSVEANVTLGRWAWASRFVDINNDGWEDLVVANGFVTSHRSKDL